MDYIIHLNGFDFREYGEYIAHCIHDKVFFNNRYITVTIENKILKEIIQKLKIFPVVLENILFDYLASNVLITLKLVGPSSDILINKHLCVQVFMAGFIDYVKFKFSYEYSLTCFSHFIPVSGNVIIIHGRNLKGLIIRNSSSFIEEKVITGNKLQRYYFCNSHLLLLDHFMKNTFNEEHYFAFHKGDHSNNLSYHNDHYVYHDSIDTRNSIKLKVTNVQHLIICATILREIYTNIAGCLKKFICLRDLSVFM